jgi:hypothetical protein
MLAIAVSFGLSNGKAIAAAFILTGNGNSPIAEVVFDSMSHNLDVGGTNVGRWR